MAKQTKQTKSTKGQVAVVDAYGRKVGTTAAPKQPWIAPCEPAQLAACKALIPSHPVMATYVESWERWYAADALFTYIARCKR